MKTEHMREFIDLAKTRSYSRTAESFFLSQSALSKHMATMEIELNVELFDRSSPGVELSRSGVFVLEQCRKMIDIMDEMMSHLEAVRSGHSGTLKVGLLYYAAADYCLPLLEQFNSVYPNVEIRTTSGQPDNIYDKLIHKLIDVAILNFFDISLDRYHNDEIEMIPLFSEQSIVMCRSNNSLAERDMLSPLDLRGCKFIRYQNGPFMESYNANVLECLQRYGVRFSDFVFLDNIDFLTATVKQNNGICIFPKHVEGIHNKLVSIPLVDFPSMLTCLFIRKDNGNPVIDVFKNTMVKVCKSK